MKIAIIHNKYKKSGGTETYLFALTKGLSDAGDQVDIHTYRVDKKETLPPGCHIIKYPLWFLPRKLRKFAFIKLINRWFDPSDYDMTLTLTRTSKTRAAIIGGLHAAWVKKNSSEKKISFNDNLELKNERNMLDHSKIIVAHSKLLKEEIATNYPNCNKKTTVLYPPVCSKQFKKAAPSDVTAFQKKHGINPNQTNFLFPSTGHARKGLPHLIDCFKKLDSSQYKLWIAGNTVHEKLPENIRCLGFITEMNQAYSSMDYTVLPAEYEPFGLVVPESLNCGTPVIVNKNVGAAQLMAENDGVILENNSAIALYDAIIKLNKNRHTVTPDFIQHHQLTMSQHISNLKKLYSTPITSI